MIGKPYIHHLQPVNIQKKDGFAIPATSNLSVLAISFTFLTPFSE
jgi:hypothetical protein